MSADLGTCLARLPLRIFLAQRLALVVLLLAAGDGELELRAPFLEVAARHDERHALLRRFLHKFIYLAAVEEQLPRPHNVVIIDIPV